MLVHLRDVSANTHPFRSCSGKGETWVEPDSCVTIFPESVAPRWLSQKSEQPKTKGPSEAWGRLWGKWWTEIWCVVWGVHKPTGHWSKGLSSVGVVVHEKGPCPYNFRYRADCPELIGDVCKQDFRILDRLNFATTSSRGQLAIPINVLNSHLHFEDFVPHIYVKSLTRRHLSSVSHLFKEWLDISFVSDTNLGVRDKEWTKYIHTYIKSLGLDQAKYK